MMKKLLIPLVAVIMMAASCGDNPSVTHDDGANEADGNAVEAKVHSASLATTEEIDTFTAQVDQAINYKNIERYYPTIYSKKDAVFLYKPDGELKRLTCGLFQEDVESRAFYYLDKGELVFHRKREWHFKGEQPFAKETICYIKNGDVIDVQQRRVSLAPGEKPGQLMGQDFFPAKLDGDSLFNAIKKDFKELKAAADRSQINVKPQ